MHLLSLGLTYLFQTPFDICWINLINSSESFKLVLNATFKHSSQLPIVVVRSRVLEEASYLRLCSSVSEFSKIIVSSEGLSEVVKPHSYFKVFSNCNLTQIEIFYVLQLSNLQEIPFKSRFLKVTVYYLAAVFQCFVSEEFWGN